MDYNDMIEFTYYPDENSYQRHLSMTFHVSPDMPFKELAEMFRAFAYALGYAEETINDYISEDNY